MSPARTSSSTVVVTARSSSEPHISCTAAAIWRRICSCLPRAGPALVELAQQREDACELADGRVAPRLRRVCGEDEAHLGLGERLVQLRGARALGGELRDRGVQRAAARTGRGVELADAAHAVEVLGEVHELKPAREHADEQHDLGQLEAGDELRELVRRGGVAAARALAELDRAAVQLERLRSLDRADDLVEDAAEQRLVVGVRAALGV